MSGGTEKALGNFLAEFDTKQQKVSKRAVLDEHTIAKKRAGLEPIRKLLSRFSEFGVIVPDADRGARGVAADATKNFTYYEGESSPSWRPGVSLFFDHPIPVEIAIPNDYDIPKEGVIVIRLANSHRDQNLLLQRFATVELAAEALAKFIGKAALGMTNDPRRPKQVKHDAAMLKGAPSELPPDSER